MSRNQRFALVIILVVVRLVLLGYGLSTLDDDAGSSGLGISVWRYHALATTPGVPYRDFQVENAPLSVGLVSLIDPGSARGLATRLAVTMFLCELIAIGLIRWGWGDDAAFRLLLLDTPLALFIYLRLDLLSVALAVLALSLVRKSFERSGGIALGAAAMAKIWPIVAIPFFLLRGSTRAAAYAIASSLIAVLVWVVAFGTGGIGQVLTFRHATGYEIGSNVGLLMWRVLGWPTRYEAGAIRVGTRPWWAAMLEVSLTIAVVTVVAIRTRSRADLADGPGMTVAVSALLLFAPLFSDSYVVWLVPWVAIAADERVTLWTGIATIATTGSVLVSISGISNDASAIGAMLLIRNASILIVGVSAFRSLEAKAKVPEAKAP